MQRNLQFKKGYLLTRIALFLRFLIYITRHTTLHSIPRTILSRGYYRDYLHFIMNLISSIRSTLLIYPLYIIDSYIL